MSDMADRWARAKLGGRSYVGPDGKRWQSIIVECDGDPRAEVLRVIELAANEPIVVPPQRKRAKKGGE